MKTLCLTLALLSSSLRLYSVAQGVAASPGVVIAADTSIAIAEVRVTAGEVRSAATSASFIGPTAMEHLQPASLADVLTLLPGGLTQAPRMGGVNMVALREVPSAADDYAVSALGTKILVDDAPISVDANMQRVSGAGQTDSDNGRSSVNMGVDLRTIPTDDVEEVQVIRGVPSVAYGDLTSGVVSLRRRLSASPVVVRLKADPYSRIVSVSKGVDAPRGWTLVAGAAFLKAAIDPRSDYETYRRLNVSLRGRKVWSSAAGLSLSWQPVADYSQNVDDVKSDPEQQTGRDDSYRSSYRRVSLSNALCAKFGSWQSELHHSLSFSADEVSQRMRFVNAQNLYAPSDTTDGQPHDVAPLEKDYVARHVVDGKPFYCDLKIAVSHGGVFRSLRNKISLGGEWRCRKNFGRGQVFDSSRPLHGSTSRRPRSFRSVPVSNALGLFVEDEFEAPVGVASLRIVAGVRLSSLAGLGREFDMAGMVYADPRANVVLTAPASWGRMSLAVGLGRLSKMPTMDQLYPEDVFIELAELDYWNANPALRRRVTRTYAISPSSCALRPARNVKLDVRLAASVARHSASVSFFREVMNDGFRSEAAPVALSYFKYDASAVDGSALAAPPALSSLPRCEAAQVCLVRSYVNGSRIRKVGIEWQYDSPRLKALSSRISVAGAWLRTTRENSVPEWFQGTGVTVAGVVVDDLYAGLYDWHQTFISERTSTNVTVETYVPRAGFIFSATAECVWGGRHTVPLHNARPSKFIGPDGVIRPYTDAEASDNVLSALVLSNTAERLVTSERPYATFNFKATKEIGRYFSLSFFADRLLAAAKDYEAAGFVVRRSFSPYFGVQAYVKFL